MLKHLALQQAAAGPIIVLSPGRTTPRGWTAMRSVIGFDGSCRELLVEVAAGGRATIFLDGLEHFAQDERPTACDLIREAVGVPGVTVVAHQLVERMLRQPVRLIAPEVRPRGRNDDQPVIIAKNQIIRPNLNSPTDNHRVACAARDRDRSTRSPSECDD